jgi:hypothetical protein
LLKNNDLDTVLVNDILGLEKDIILKQKELKELQS